ncbi:MAG: helix-turn-helix transcriptional regulator [Firmicutes bacterium]|nr:helix-turn-helix transcriptional regulator [Bacillota bacterium]
MTILNVGDWRKINDFLLQTGQIYSLKNYPSIILDACKGLINYESANFFIHINPHHNSLDKPYVVNISDNTLIDYIKYYQFLDPMKEKTFNQPEPTKSTKIMNYQEWQTTEYFSDFIQPNGFYYSCGIDLHYKEKLLATLSLFRDRHSPDFSAKELYFFHILKPHLGNQLYKLIVIESKDSSRYTNYSQLIGQLADKFGLSTREAEVVNLVIKGATNQEIADSLFISINTVKKHLYKIFNKTNSASRTELIARTLDINLVLLENDNT